MREPRPKQRFPRGGKELYELLRMDHEPTFINVFRSDEVAADRHKQADTLVWEVELDPMLYFWPVEGQHVVVLLDKVMEEKRLERLAKALLRDGATWISALWTALRTEEERREFRPDHLTKPVLRHWGDMHGFLCARFGTREPVAVPGGSGQQDGGGAARGAQSGALFTDRERQDEDGLDADPASASAG